MNARRIVYGMLALSIVLGLGAPDAGPVDPVSAEEGSGESDPCVTVDPYTGEVTVDPDCVSEP